MAQPTWILDADDPRAPTREVWDRMTPAEREQVVASLPTDMPLDLHPPEGDTHRKPKDRATPHAGLGVASLAAPAPVAHLVIPGY